MSSSLAVFLSSLKMAVATFCSRILGLVREQAMAWVFGASGYTDAFLIAYRIPNLLRDLFAEGAFSSAFVPNFIEQNQKSQEQGRQLLWALFIILGLSTLFFSGLIFIFAEQLIILFAPSFKESPEKFEITVTLTRIMSPFLLFVSLAALFMGVLNSLKVFFLPSMAPAFFNIVMIGAIFGLPGYFSSQGIPTVYSLGVGVFIGGLVQACIQFPLILKKGHGPLWPKQIWSVEAKKVLTLLGPGLIGFAATQINLLVNTILASGTVVGAVSWLSYAFRLFQLPVGILSVSIGNSNLVHFGEAWKANNKENAKSLIQSSFFLSLVLVAAPMVGLIIFAEPIVRLIFERGMFSGQSTLMTAKALKWYALGLPFYGIYKIFVPAFYAIGRQKVPVYCSILSVGLNVIFCISLVPYYGFEVLALGTSLSMLVNSSIQTWVLCKDLGVGLRHFYSMRVLKVIIASLFTAMAMYAVQKNYSQVYSDLSFQLLEVAIKLALVVLCYAVCLLTLGEGKVVRSFVNKVKNKL